MQNNRWSLQIVGILFLFGAVSVAADVPDGRVLPSGKLPNDARLKPLKDLNGYFPFIVPESKEAWQQRADELRRRVLVATGLWPMPERTAMHPVIHGKVQREGFTFEKVHFESVPGHFVTGLLFRPDDGKTAAKRPAVLSPHGHGGRMQDYGEQQIRKLIAQGAERFEGSGRFPKLARCAQLARMGCVVFIFDMLGYADSQQISYQLAHRYAKSRPDFEGKDRFGLYSAQAEMRLQSIMGIQTWNSVRCLDFLQQLPDVDPDRIAVTGGSGGGTQTILLCAIDPRPVAAFPNGMVSTSMQGGCTCENCSLLRVGTGNVELAALFAPKPQAMTAANDWTRKMMTEGYPTLQKLYALVGKEKDVYCRPLLHFPHNYNYVTRATMYSWMNKHLQLGLEEPVLEEDFVPLSAEEATVWNDKHPAPEGGDKHELELTRYMTQQSDKAIAALIPADADSLAEYRRVVGGAIETIVGRSLPNQKSINRNKLHEEAFEGYLYFEDLIRLEGRDEEIPAVTLYPTGKAWSGDAVIWIDSQGKASLFNDQGAPTKAVRTLLDSGASIIAADLFGQGEFLADGKPIVQQDVVKNPREAAAYTFCYNDTLMARRIHDVLTVIAYVRGFEQEKPERVQIVASGTAAPIVAAARALSGDAVDRCALLTTGFRFANISSYRDPSFMPGVVKYGDLPAIMALSAPTALWVAGETPQSCSTTQAVFQAAGSADAFTVAPSGSVMDAVQWLVKQ